MSSDPSVGMPGIDWETFVRETLDDLMTGRITPDQAVTWIGDLVNVGERHQLHLEVTRSEREPNPLQLIAERERRTR